MKLNFINTRWRIVRFLGIGAILFTVLPSCHRSDSRLDYKAVNGDGWLSTESVNLKIDSLSSSDHYSLSVGLRTSSACSYPFRKIVLEVCQNWNKPNLIRIDTIHCELSALDGEIQGRGVSVYSYQFVVDSVHLEAGDSAMISVRHLMRQSPLPGIYNVGVLLQPIE